MSDTEVKRFTRIMQKITGEIELYIREENYEEALDKVEQMQMCMKKLHEQLENML